MASRTVDGTHLIDVLSPAKSLEGKDTFCECLESIPSLADALPRVDRSAPRNGSPRLPRPIPSREPVVGELLVNLSQGGNVEEWHRILLSQRNDGEDVRDLAGWLGEDSAEVTIDDALEVRVSDDPLVY